MPHRRPTDPAQGRLQERIQGEGLARQVQDAATLLESVRRTLADLLRQVLDGDLAGGTLRDLGARQTDLEAALRRALEAEARWLDWQARHEAAGGDGGIDFDALREGIACHLARLRECCQDE